MFENRNESYIGEEPLSLKLLLYSKSEIHQNETTNEADYFEQIRENLADFSFKW